ncbi:MAG: SIS domain-containing protein [Clostridia bacterium]|nr:SIS domain-containing protein [Clostridia bacterium]
MKPCDYFQNNMKIIGNALNSILEDVFEQLLSDCGKTIRNGNKIVVSGLGKNVAICEKFVGTMVSLGLDASFLHTNSAIHGDIGIVHPGDLVIILTKSAGTFESKQLYDVLKKRKGVTVWLLTFNKNGELTELIDNKLIIDLEHEGDMWNLIPNNSTAINLIVLQAIAILLSERLGLTVENDFKPNHPGGAIGRVLYNE